MRLSASVFILMMPFLALAQTDEYPWPEQRNGVDGKAVCAWKGEGELKEWHFTNKGVRSYKRGLTVWASPAVTVIKGRPMAFIGGYDQTMHALDLLSKERRWFKITNGPVSDAPAVGKVDGEEIVYWGSSDRFIYAHFAENGARLWSRELVEPSSTLSDADITSILLHDGVLYVAAFVYDRSFSGNMQKSWLFALDMKSGKLFWKQELCDGPVSSPIGRVVNGKFMIFICARRGLLQAFTADAQKADKVWTYQMPHEVLSSPAIEKTGDKPLLFLGSKFGDLIAIDAVTGEKRWKRMTGNWIDNNACVADVGAERMVFVGSHDYNLYALRAADGTVIWKRPVGGEIYSAPAFFEQDGQPMVAIAALDNHMYVIDAGSGNILTSYFTGEPVWDKVTKGETLWGSPAVLEGRSESLIIHGSYNGYVYSLPVKGESGLRAKAQSSRTLWVSIMIAGLIFCGIILPAVILIPRKKSI